MKNMPKELTDLIEAARKAAPSREVALKSLHCLDLTSLNDSDTPDVISKLTAKADQGELGHVAATCVYPQFLTQTFNDTASKGINRATVINFPSGKGTVEQTTADTKAAIAKGANEIDIVLDYEAVKKGDYDEASKLLKACKDACGKDAKMKVIIESAAFDDCKGLMIASVLAIVCKADFIKTSTGKSAQGGATLEAAGTMLAAIASCNTDGRVGLKVSGGVKTVADCAQYIALAESIMGKDWARPENFRFGASGVMDDILKTLGKPSGPSQPNPSGY